MEINNDSVGDLVSDLLSENIDLDTFKKAMVKHNEKALVNNVLLGLGTEEYKPPTECKYKYEDIVVIINQLTGLFIVDKSFNFRGSGGE